MLVGVTARGQAAGEPLSETPAAAVTQAVDERAASLTATVRELPSLPADDTAGDTDAEALLARWRERVLTGVVITAIVALTPAALLQYWQSTHGVAGAGYGVEYGLLGCLALGVLAVWRARVQVRAVVLIGTGFAITSADMFFEGFSPGTTVAVCTISIVCALLFSARAAAVLVVASAATMALSAAHFAYAPQLARHYDHFDVDNPYNWLRVGLYTLFASATAAVAASYLLDKLRQTLRARTRLVARLSQEIDSRERALRALEATQAELLQARKLEAIGQLAAGIAHDFNNTLSVVALEADLLKRRNTPEAVARSSEALQAAAERGRQLTDQLLLFARPHSIDRPVIDATRSFEECVRALKRLLPSEITFEVEIAAGPIALAIHPSELQQIVLNLGINARDAMPSGGTLRLALEACTLDAAAAETLGLPPGRYVILHCSDTGTGMSPATLERVFEPFFSTKGPGRGTGLGLTNVWNIAQRAGGAVRAASIVGHGTTFRLFLPRSASAAHPLQGTQDANAAHGRETILVVEDDIRIRALLVTTLQDAGYAVLDAPNADAALAIERAHPGRIDLLCTDAVMPGRPARELASELRSRRPDMGVLVCSGYSEDEQLARGIRRGEWKHLRKPFTRDALLQAVRASLRPERAPSDLPP